MEASIERARDLDVHQATVVACLIGLANGKVKKTIRTCGTATRKLLALGEWSWRWRAGWKIITASYYSYCSAGSLSSSMI